MSIYSEIDRHPLLLRFLFYPRQWTRPAPAGAEDFMVPVEENIAIGCRLYEGEAGWPWVLLFHGNGEIAADYDQIAPFYHQKRLILLSPITGDTGAAAGSQLLPAWSRMPR